MAKAFRVKLPTIEIGYDAVEITEESAAALSNCPAILRTDIDEASPSLYIRDNHITQNNADTLAEILGEEAHATPDDVLAVFCNYYFTPVNLYPTLFRAIVIYQVGDKYYALHIEP